jgi:hypothetical protein
MAEDEPTTEKIATGYTVPVPKRHEFFGNLKRGAKPDGPKRVPDFPQNRGNGARRMPTPRGNAPGK